MPSQEVKLVTDRKRVYVIGGGAAGFFGAIAAAQRGHQVTILEAAAQVLAKVRISGGGRCNVTHHCFDPRELVKHYPRGAKQLRGPFSKFQPSDTIEWFAERGVRTKVEPDGRMFPTTDDSATIVDCLKNAASESQVRVLTRTNVVDIDASPDGFLLTTQTGQTIDAERLLLATGGGKAGLKLASKLGHNIIDPVPSLFTFNMQDPRLEGLQGIAVESVRCKLVVETKSFEQAGPLLITHWGMSGPAVLKLSAVAARELHNTNYQAALSVNWLAPSNTTEVQQALTKFKANNGKKNTDSVSPFPLPKRLWQSLVKHIGAENVRWADLSKTLANQLATELTSGSFSVSGKGVFKEEFVTCGGIDLNEVDFRSMESRVSPGLFFAGEILDVDGLTGGFNFQNAWTTSWIAGNSI